MGLNSAYIRFWAGLSISLFFNAISQSAFNPLFDVARVAQPVTVKDISNLDTFEVVREVEAASKPEDVEAASKLGDQRPKILLMFDLNGTLRSHLDPQKKKIDRWVHGLLASLSQDPRFEVWLNTGKSDKSLRATYQGEKFKNMGWYAEHGTIFSAPGASEATDLNHLQKGWLDSTMRAIKCQPRFQKQTSLFSILTPSSAMIDMLAETNEYGKELWPGNAARDQEKKATITFTTRTPSKEFDKFFEELKDVLKGTSVVTQHKETKTLIEVTPKGFNKGTAVDHLMSKTTNKYNLALAAGDDERDLEMHEKIRQHMMEANQKAYSIIITKDYEKPTAANYHIEHYHHFLRDLLAKLSPDYKEKWPLTES